MGDEDLAGHETPPTLLERQARLKKEIGQIKSLEDIFRSGNCDISDHNSLEKYLQGETLSLIKVLSNRLRELRQMDVKTHQAVDMLMKKVDNTDWMKSKVANAISFFKGKSIKTSDAIKDLSGIDDLGQLSAAINKCETQYLPGSSVSIDLGKQTNYVCLRAMTPDTLSALDLACVSSRIKQRTAEWHIIRNQARVTGSTLFSALGLKTLKQRKVRYDYVFSGIPKEFSHQSQEAMKHGTENKKNGVATLLTKILPALYPNHTYVEDGCEIMREGNFKIVVSGDGSLQSSEDPGNQIAVEIKCPVPNKLYATDVHYQLPLRYSNQVISEMGSKGCKEFLYLSYTPSSTTVIKGHMDWGLFTEIRDLACDMYKEDGKRPTKTDPRSVLLRNKLKQYAEQSSFVAEFPSIQGEECKHELADSLDTVMQGHTSEACLPSKTRNLSEWADSISDLQFKIKTAYNLLRKPCKEVLVTVISDLDRIKTDTMPDAPHAVPIMYRMAGYSLKMDSVRGIINDGITACSERGLDVKAVAFDGQFVEISREDDKGFPLTLLKLQKSIWFEASQLSKHDQIALMTDRNNVGSIQNISDLEKHIIVEKHNCALYASSRHGCHTFLSPPNLALLCKKEMGKPSELSDDLRSVSNGNEEYCAEIIDDENPPDTIVDYLPAEVISELDEADLLTLENANGYVTGTDDLFAPSQTEEGVLDAEHLQASGAFSEVILQA